MKELVEASYNKKGFSDQHTEILKCVDTERRKLQITAGNVTRVAGSIYKVDGLKGIFKLEVVGDRERRLQALVVNPQDVLAKKKNPRVETIPFSVLLQ